jgi:hypothetical protein
MVGTGLFWLSQPIHHFPLWLEYIFPIVLAGFAFVGALVISRQSRNVIGWLMLLPGSSLAPFMDGVVSMYVNGLWRVPTLPSPFFLLLIWFSNWNWLLLIFPLLFLLVLFPTGRPFTRRWRWLLPYGAGLMLFIIGLNTFAKRLAAETNESFSFVNPIGFVESGWVDTYVLPIFFVALPVWVVLCVAALFVRFRQAGQVERNQIKWLFWAAAVFAATYIPTFLFSSFTDAESWWNILWLLGMLMIPIAVAMAILRYGLYDIDVIIRKTVQYGVVTAVLAIIYFGTIILLQSLVGQATGEQSPIIIVLSTLLIAALFNPLRRRVQTAVDRRFFRKKYNAQQVLAQFAQTTQNETDMEALQAELLRVVQETMQPETVSIWIKR